MELFDLILKANSDTGNILGLQYGIVADVNDPLKLQRIQVYDQAKGGQFKSGWLLRGLPFTSFSPPVPKKDDLVIFGYIGGDPHHGCYLGAVVNKNNKPVGADSDYTIKLGTVVLSIDASTGDISVQTDGKASVTAKGDVNIFTQGKATVAAVGDATVTSQGNIKLEAKKLTFKANQVVFDSPSIDLGSPGTAKLSGKGLVVEGATDSRGDTITNKGW